MTPVLLLDADIIAFQIAAVSQQTYQFPDCEPSTIVDEWEEVEPRIVHAIDKLKAALDTDLVIVCLSCPTEENWRMAILPTYKGNRDYSKRPAHLAAVKEFMATNWPSYRRDTLEADDIMGILSTMKGLPSSFLAAHPEFRGHGRKIIVSEDKDMKTIPGWLFNPAKDTLPRLIEQPEADRWHLLQTICGDTTDGYTGCPGAGPAAAGPVLDGAMWVSYTHAFTRGARNGQEELRWVLGDDPEGNPWNRLVSLYARYGLTEADALVQAQVARICRASDYDFTNRKVIPWTPHAPQHEKL